MMRKVLAAAYTANAVVGTIVSVKHGIAARPLGLSTGWSVQRDLALGFGAGLAAPWPMVAVLWWAGVSDAASANRVARLLAALFLVGALAEEDTYRAMRGRVSRMAAVAAVGNLLLPPLLILSTVRPRQDRGGTGCSK